MTVNREAGPLADEAALLVEAALGWAQRAAASVDPTGERLATGAPECTGCPVCRTVSALRDPSPEFTERLTHTVTELATVVAAGLRFASDARGRWSPDAPADDAPHPPQQRGTHGPGVEHIDIA